MNTITSKSSSFPLFNPVMNKIVENFGRIWKKMMNFHSTLLHLTQKVKELAKSTFKKTSSLPSSPPINETSSSLFSASLTHSLPISKNLCENTLSLSFQSQTTSTENQVDPKATEAEFKEETETLSNEEFKQKVDSSTVNSVIPISFAKEIEALVAETALLKEQVVDLPLLLSSILPNPSSMLSKLALAIDMPNDGNCQLHAILKGIQLQYPLLAKRLNKNSLVNYTSQDLRKVAITYIKNSLQESGSSIETLKAYLNNDIKEYNEEIERQATTYLYKETERIRDLLKQDVREKKITSTFALSLILTIRTFSKPSGFYIQRIHSLKAELNANQETEKTYIKLIETIFENHQQLLQKGNKGKINSIEEYCQLSCQDKFYCSTSFLFALSSFFKVPIFVYDQQSLEFDPQVFTIDPIKDPIYHAKHNPIQLLKVKNNHYQYIWDPKTHSAA